MIVYRYYYLPKFCIFQRKLYGKTFESILKFYDSGPVVISGRCLLVAVALAPMCCYTGKLCRRHRTWHPTLWQYTDTHWNSQLPILMSWVWPNQEVLPRPSTQAANAQHYDAAVVSVSQNHGRMRTVLTESWIWNPLLANPLSYLLGQSCFWLILYKDLIDITDILLNL